KSGENSPHSTRSAISATNIVVALNFQTPSRPVQVHSVAAATKKRFYWRTKNVGKDKALFCRPHPRAKIHHL
ncbi:MAG TPA: hypothetical protein VFY40_15420, partial [Blastocatellia bacterium]|nr:hypothetical protein [Blastocatellia bacterium]